MTLLLVTIAVCAVLGGTLALGVWIGRGIREDQAADAEAARQLADLEARRARPTLVLEAATAPVRPRMPTGRPNYHPGDFIGPGRIPGYTDPFPRPGRLDVAAAVVVAGPAAPHVGPARPSTSPVDLEADVRRMCDENELYVAALIARTRHAERNYQW